MPADIDELTAFTAAVTGESLGLRGSNGEQVGLRTETLREVITELTALRENQDELEQIASVAANVQGYVDRLTELAPGDLPHPIQIRRDLVAILDQEDNSHPPELLHLLAKALPELDGDDITRATQVLDLIRGWVAGSGSQEVEQLVEVAKAPQTGPRLVPSGPEFKPELAYREVEPITTETERRIAATLGLRRGENSRYDSGDLNGSEDIEDN